MGTMGPLLATRPLPSGGGEAREPLLQGYRSCLQQALFHLVEYDGVPTTDPRVLALTTHLSRRQAAFELQEELRRRSRPQEEHRQLLADYFRGVDLHYTS